MTKNKYENTLYIEIFRNENQQISSTSADVRSYQRRLILPVLLKIRMYIKKIKKDLAIEFIQKYHYSKIMPRLTIFYLGIYDESKLLGAVTLGWGTQPLQTIKKIFYKHDVVSNDYLEIGKMCFLPEMNRTKSFGSQVISMLIKWMEQNTECLFLYTLADGIMGKPGYVYQASNFRYLGNFKTSVYYDRKTGEKIHPRSAKTLLEENAKFDDVKKRHWLSYEFCEFKELDKIQGLMFRYIYPLNKKGKKMLKRYDEYKNLKNPKQSDLLFERRVSKGKYERIKQPKFNMNVFNYNYQKY